MPSPTGNGAAFRCAVGFNVYTASFATFGRDAFAYLLARLAANSISLVNGLVSAGSGAIDASPVHRRKGGAI